jgi:hypothetical protein
VGVWDARDFVVKIPNEMNDRLYLANHDGLVLCLQDSSREHDRPIWHQAPKKPEAAPVKPVDELPEQPPGKPLEPPLEKPLGKPLEKPPGKPLEKPLEGDKKPVKPLDEK